MMSPTRLTYASAAATFCFAVALGTAFADDPDPEVCYERCMELVKKGKIKDKKKCDFCHELKKQGSPE